MKTLPYIFCYFTTFNTVGMKQICTSHNSNLFTSKEKMVSFIDSHYINSFAYFHNDDSKLTLSQILLLCDKYGPAVPFRIALDSGKSSSAIKVELEIFWYHVNCVDDISIGDEYSDHIYTLFDTTVNDMRYAKRCTPDDIINFAIDYKYNDFSEQDAYLIRSNNKELKELFT